MVFIKNIKGTTLVLTLIVLMVLSIILGTTMEWQLVESRLTKRATSSTQAMLGSNSVHELAIAEIDSRLLDRSTLDEDEFTSTPLTVPSDATILSGLGLTAAEASITTKEVSTSYIPQVASTNYIDPADDANKYDPDKGKNVFSRYLMIFNKIGIDYTSPQVSETIFRSALLIDAREDHLFSNAIFSDMDLIILKPPNFRIAGPVHTNGFLVLVPSNDNIELDGMVTVVKSLVFPASGGGQEIKFKTDTGFDTIAAAYTGTDWKNYALQKWDGWLQTAEMGIKERAPIGFAKDASEENKFRGVIAPAEDATDPATDKAMESQKMATKAGVVFEIKLRLSNSGYNDGEGAAHFPAKSTLDPMDPGSYSSPGYNSVADKGTAEAEFDANVIADGNTISYRVYGYGSGSEKVYRQEGSNINIVGKDSMNITDISKMIYTQYDAIAHPEMLGHVGDPIKMWDARRRLWVHLVDIDIFAIFLETIKFNAGDFNAPADWNGILYIHVLGWDGSGYKNIEDLPELDPHRRVGVRLINATTVPRIQGGFTLATNVPLYLKGSFNTDDNLATGTSSTKDPTAGQFEETPAALMGDALTVLSKNWVDRSSKGDVSRPGSDTYNDREVAADVEISAGILTGYGVFLGGGINNLVRYVEMMDGQTVRIRGSLAALFKSEIAYEPFADFYVYYPPDREFGMHEFFNDPSNPQFPPGDPLLRTWRKVFRQDVSEAEFNELKTNLTTPGLSAQDFKDEVITIRKKYRDLGQ